MLLIMWIVVDGRVKTLLDGNKQTITIGVFSDSYWGVQNGYSYQIIDDAIKIFEDEHPGVKVEYVSGIMKNDYSEWLAEQLLNGTAPDVFFIMKSDFNDFAQLGGLKDLSGFIKSDTDFSEDDFYKSAFESGKYMDTQYALPYECAPRLMFINKTILDQENISMPDKDWTWEDFYNLCKNVTKDTNGDGVIDQFGVVGYSWKDAFYENNVNLFNEDGTMGGRKVIIRTLDIGADKQVDYFKLDKEENPALGYRAIRICLTRPEIFKTQLRALFRASAYGNLAIMYPMIISVDEVVKIKEISKQVKDELTKEGIKIGNVEEGIMIETPAAALMSDELAKHVDFFSIGTNDLTQYTLAIDRQNAKLDCFYDAHHPALLRAIKMIIENAHKAGIWAGICGELGADTSLTQSFIDMGIDELSVSPGCILTVRKAIREAE